MSSHRLTVYLYRVSYIYSAESLLYKQTNKQTNRTVVVKEKYFCRLSVCVRNVRMSGRCFNRARPLIFSREYAGKKNSFKKHAKSHLKAANAEGDSCWVALDPSPLEDLSSALEEASPPLSPLAREETLKARSNVLMTWI